MKTARNASLGTRPAITLSEFVERDYWPAKQGLSRRPCADTGAT